MSKFDKCFGLTHMVLGRVLHLSFFGWEAVEAV